MKEVEIHENGVCAQVDPDGELWRVDGEGCKSNQTVVVKAAEKKNLEGRFMESDERKMLGGRRERGRRGSEVEGLDEGSGGDDDDDGGVGMGTTPVNLKGEPILDLKGTGGWIAAFFIFGNDAVFVFNRLFVVFFLFACVWFPLDN